MKNKTEKETQEQINKKGPSKSSKKPAEIGSGALIRDPLTMA